MDTRPELEATLQAARHAWPGLSVDDRAFAEYVSARLPEGATAEVVARWHVTDLFLAYACARGDAVALRTFDAQFLTKVPSFVAGLRQSSAFADEVGQALRVKLLVPCPDAPARIEGYSGRGPLDRWVRVSAVNTALHIMGREKDAPDKGHDDAAKVIGHTPSPEIDFMKHRYRPEFEAALREAFAALTPRQRNLLRLHFIDGLSAIAIGAAFGAHRATATRWLSGASEALLDETKRLLRLRLGLTESELVSVMTIVRSGIDMSLDQILRAETGG
jgi:RNA polymerase sigma-70 factor (ECF subfamily)